MDITIRKETTLEKDGRTIVCADWSDGSVSLELWDGRFLWYNPDTKEVWDLTPGQEGKNIAVGLTVGEFMVRYTTVQ